MKDAHSVDDLLDFLQHASQRGLMPAATAGSIASSARTVFGVLEKTERADLRSIDIDKVIKRFETKRARDFNPTSLKEYGRRARRALELYASWKGDPANFSVKTRATTSSKHSRPSAVFEPVGGGDKPYNASSSASDAHTYATSFPVRAGLVVNVSNIPYDLSSAEAERLAQYIRMLAADL